MYRYRAGSRFSRNRTDETGIRRIKESLGMVFQGDFDDIARQARREFGGKSLISRIEGYDRGDFGCFVCGKYAEKIQPYFLFH